MSINSNVTSTNIDSLEYTKFVEIVNDSRFPPLSVTRTSYDDNITQTTVYSKNAVLTYDIGTQTTNASPFGDNASSDAFGRLRVGIPQTLFDSKMLYDKAPFVYDEQVNLGTSTFVPGDSLVIMSTNASGGFAIRQTTSRFNYQPGKSMFANLTFLAAPETNIVKRMGLFQGLSTTPFTPTDGMYLEVTSSGPSFNIVKTEGTTNTLTIPQSSWNVDKLDGTGASGLTIDFTKGQIFAIDYEWLGLGRVRFGFYLQGKLYYAHYVTNFNSLSAPYITSPNQPIRYEIRQTGAGSGSMKQICSTVVEEGAPEEIGYSVTAATTATVTVQNNVMTPVLAVRLAPYYSNLSLFLKEFSMFNIDNTSNAMFTLYRDPVVSGGSLVWRKPPDSSFEFAYGSASLTLSGGYTLYSGFVPKSQGTSSGVGTQALQGLIGRFGTKIDGTPSVLAIGAMGLGATVPIYASANAFIKS